MLHIYDKLSSCTTSGEVNRLLAGNGLTIVPKEPTVEMIRAGCETDCKECFNDCKNGPYVKIYKAMLDAVNLGIHLSDLPGSLEGRDEEAEELPDFVMFLSDFIEDLDELVDKYTKESYLLRNSRLPWRRERGRDSLNMAVLLSTLNTLTTAVAIILKRNEEQNDGHK